MLHTAQLLLKSHTQSVLLSWRSFSPTHQRTNSHIQHPLINIFFYRYADIHTTFNSHRPRKPREAGFLVDSHTKESKANSSTSPMPFLPLLIITQQLIFKWTTWQNMYYCIFCVSWVKINDDENDEWLQNAPHSDRKFDWLIDYLFAQTCYKTAQVMATEHEQDSQAPSALIAALIA